MNFDTKDGTIVELPSNKNGYSYVVLVDYEQDPWYIGTLGSPKDAKVGDRCVLHYTVTRSRGFWTWKNV